MSGSTNRGPSVTCTFWHWGFSEAHSSSGWHKLCVPHNKWSYTESFVVWTQLCQVSDRWALAQGWYLLPVNFLSARCQAKEDKELSQGLISACQGQCWGQMLMQQRPERREMKYLLKAAQPAKPMQQWTGFASCSTTHGETQANLTITFLHPSRRWFHLFWCCELPLDFAWRMWSAIPSIPCLFFSPVEI